MSEELYYIIVQDEHIEHYIEIVVYGTLLCHLSADTLSKQRPWDQGQLFLEQQVDFANFADFLGSICSYLQSVTLPNQRTSSTQGTFNDKEHGLTTGLSYASKANSKIKSVIYIFCLLFEYLFLCTG